MTDQAERRLERDGKATEAQAARCRRGDHDWLAISTSDMVACRVQPDGRPVDGARPYHVLGLACAACRVVEWRLGDAIVPRRSVAQEALLRMQLTNALQSGQRDLVATVMRELYPHSEDGSPLGAVGQRDSDVGRCFYMFQSGEQCVNRAVGGSEIACAGPHRALLESDWKA